jgi:hypothetical protein
LVPRVGGEPGPIVDHFHGQQAVGDLPGDQQPAGVGVLDHVGEGFLRRAECGRLQRGV